MRGRGLWVAFDMAPGAPAAREICERLLAAGVLCKDAHETTVRLAPPLIVSRADLDWCLERLDGVLARV